MKILIFIIGVFLGAYAVSLTHVVNITYKEINVDATDIFETVEIENCQYLVIKSATNNTIMFTHKGNCNNVIHGFDEEEEDSFLPDKFSTHYTPKNKRQ